MHAALVTLAAESGGDIGFGEGLLVVVGILALMCIVGGTGGGRR